MRPEWPALPAGCGLLEVFESEFALGATSYRMVGMSAPSSRHGEVVGSAVGTGPDTSQRAYFELWERAVLFDADARAQEDTEHPGFPGLAFDGTPLGRLEPTAVFPRSPSPETWTYARSSGVAAHADLTRACMSAVWELIERDRVLRAWWGQYVPRPLSGVPAGALETVNERFAARFWDFGCGVVGVFGPARQSGKPFLMGFGAGANVAEACDHALRDAIQRVAFLWDEPAADPNPQAEIEFRPSVDFHLESFLLPRSFDRVQAWLDGKHLGRVPGLVPAAPEAYRLESFAFADITPEGSRSHGRVVRAISPVLIPLCFGRGNARVAPGGMPEGLWIHPFA
ncbi:MAG: YcaO-like family protein [Bacteriovoracia bacterium]